MVHFHRTDLEKLGQIYHLSFLLLGAVAFPAAVGIFMLSDQIIQLIYQDEFLGAIIPLQVLVWVIIFHYLNIPSIRMMLVFDRQKRINLFLLMSLLVNVVLNFLLDPELGATGAAISRLSAVIVLFVSVYIYISNYLFKNHALKYLINLLQQH